MTNNTWAADGDFVSGFPRPQVPTMWSPDMERDSCGVALLAHVGGQASHAIVSDALLALSRMAHRGAKGCDNAEDGVGIMLALPHEFLRACCDEKEDGEVEWAEGSRQRLPEPGGYAVGMMFLARKDDERRQAQRLVERAIAAQEELRLLGWRRVPVDAAKALGQGPAKHNAPSVWQFFVTHTEDGGGLQPTSTNPAEFERKLYILTKEIEKLGKRTTEDGPDTGSPPQDGAGTFKGYLCSLSSRTVVYKGLVDCGQLGTFYPDLRDPRVQSHVALVHARFSTNTFPSWARAQPYRVLCHNGEINTLRGNINRMRARQGVMHTPLFPEPAQLESLYPVIDETGSDSGMLDNALQFYSITSSRSLPEALATMVPETWEKDELMDRDRRAFYEYYSSVQEPWDGPALLAFTDARFAGAVLDRNGLRPARILELKDGRVILASEVGLLPVDADNIAKKTRLKPGKFFLIDFEQKRIIRDRDFKRSIATAQPYAQWLARQKVALDRDLKLLSGQATTDRVAAERLLTAPQLQALAPLLAPIEEGEAALQADPQLKAFHYTAEQINMLLTPMGKSGVEALGSMGNDEALACLSKTGRRVSEFFKQLFAQVTNPPIDPIRETVVMALNTFIGPEGNVLVPEEGHCHRLQIQSPTLTTPEFLAIAALPQTNPGLGWTTSVVDITYPLDQRLDEAIEALCEKAEEAVAQGAHFLILSDVSAGANALAVPALMATGAVHHHLIKRQLRCKCALVVASADPRDVHDLCLLVGFGADAVYPYMVYRCFIALGDELQHDGEKEKELTASSSPQQPQSQLKKDLLTPCPAIGKYRSAVDKGILKVMAKMGISTLASYKGAQVFEAVGLGRDVVKTCFEGVSSRLSGLSFRHFDATLRGWHEKGYGAGALKTLPNAGQYHWRAEGEAHAHDPTAMAKLQEATRTNSKEAFRSYSELADANTRRCMLRGLFSFRAGSPIPIDEVEPAAAIVKRFCTGAMSYGSISKETHETLAVAMNRAGGRSNSGEGGEDYERFQPLANGDSKRSAIKQVASARFGVTSYYLLHADQLQIKMAQGAKPGEGGELPGPKVSEEIGRTRHSVAGVGLISPPPHHDIYSIEDLAQLIHDLHCANIRATVSVKLVSQVGVGVVAAGVAKAHADHIVISGHDGGTGASRWTGIKYAGLPWELGLSEAQQCLVMSGLRDRVVLHVDGGIRTAFDVVVGALLGAEEFGFGTVPLIVLGCIMMRKCHLNTCPVGIATQDPVLRAKFKGQPEHVLNFFFLIAEEVRNYMAAMGFRTMDEMIGRTDMLEVSGENEARVADLGLDLSPLLADAATLRPGAGIRFKPSNKSRPADHVDAAITASLDKVASSDPNTTKEPIAIDLNVENTSRSVGATASYHVSRLFGPDGLPHGQEVAVSLRGSAGQSFGAFLASGVRMEVVGDANDYVGKGLSGGTLVIRGHGEAMMGVTAGNACLYGATSGRLFLHGRAAQRFGVRNSGAVAVIEGAGDHCCEYMTGGICVVLGKVGKNFAAGMTGGLAYVWCPTGGGDQDREADFRRQCNMEMVSLYKLNEVEPADAEQVRALIQQHADYTGSRVAAELLGRWPEAVGEFIKVYPNDYRRVMEERRWEGGLASVQKPPTPAQQPKNELVDQQHKKVGDIEDMIEKYKNVVPTGTEAKIRGFMRYPRKKHALRPTKERVSDFGEIFVAHADADGPAHEEEKKTQAARCMDCGVPFCQSETGCPISNLIPDFNALVYADKWEEAYRVLSKTNNFPEFTGRACPAPCEGACVLGINSSAVTIKDLEHSIIDRAWQEGWVVPCPPLVRTGKSVAVIGSGPAGLAAADQLNKAGHLVTVYERADRPGGLLMYGIPNMKIDKRQVVERRLRLMEQEGVKFVTGVSVGQPGAVSLGQLRAQFDAVLLACGATAARDLLSTPGRQLQGIHQAMEYLTASTRALLADEKQRSTIDARGRHVVVIGGGDTGTDCIGTSLRQGCASVINLEIMPRPPNDRADDNPWPQWPRVFKVDYGHEEAAAINASGGGGDPRTHLTSTKAFVADEATGTRVAGVRTVQVRWDKEAGSGRWVMCEVAGSEQVLKADLVLLAMGFVGPEKAVVDSTTTGDDDGEACKPEFDARGNFKAAYGAFHTSVPGVFAAGDCRRGQSLIVWAINEGRGAAAEIDRHLMGGKTALPGVAPNKKCC